MTGFFRLLRAQRRALLSALALAIAIGLWLAFRMPAAILPEVTFPRVKVIACELECAQPFGAALRAGRVVTTESRRGFVSGVGFHSLLPEMWPLARELIDGALTVSLTEVAAAIRFLAERHKVIAEGAGALPVAAALSGGHPYGKVCAVVSGGNLGGDMLSTILAGGVPA